MFVGLIWITHSEIVVRNVPLAPLPTHLRGVLLVVDAEGALAGVDVVVGHACSRLEGERRFPCVCVCVRGVQVVINPAIWSGSQRASTCILLLLHKQRGGIPPLQGSKAARAAL